jgi:drug/metabolite transporter (DMT)-like permease
VSTAATWSGIAVLVTAATAGDVLQASAMRTIGDLGELRRARGLAAVVSRVLSSPRFLLGLFFMAVGFFSLIITLSWADLSVVGPASAALTFVANAVAARIFLKEHVNLRRWLAALFAAAGVAILAR